MENKIIPLSEPIMFQYIFGTNKNKKFTIYLLESLLNYSKKITDLKILNAVDLISNNSIENVNLEIVVSLYKGNQINLAIQNDDENSRDIFLKAVKNYDEFFKKGMAYSEIPDLLQIGFIKGDEKDDIIKRIGWVNGTTKEDVNMGFCTLIINIRGNSYSQKYKAREDFEILRKLLNAETEEEIEKLALESSLIKEIVQEMKFFSKYLNEAN